MEELQQRIDDACAQYQREHAWPGFVTGARLGHAAHAVSAKLGTVVIVSAVDGRLVGYAEPERPKRRLLIPIPDRAAPEAGEMLTQLGAAPMPASVKQEPPAAPPACAFGPSLVKLTERDVFGRTEAWIAIVDTCDDENIEVPVALVQEPGGGWVVAYDDHAAMAYRAVWRALR